MTNEIESWVNELGVDDVGAAEPLKEVKVANVMGVGETNRVGCGQLEVTPDARCHNPPTPAVW